MIDFNNIDYNTYEWLYSLFIYSGLIPITHGLIRWRSLTRPERWTVAFAGALLLDELLSVLCIALHTRNHFLFYVQTITVLGTVAGVYENVIRPRHLVWYIAVGVSLLMVVEIRFGVGFNHINSITLATSRLLPTLYALLSLQRIFSSQTSRPITSTSTLYLHLGFFVIGAFTAVNAYFMSYFIETSLTLFFLFQNMSAMMSAVAFVLFTIAFVRDKPAFTTRIRQ